MHDHGAPDLPAEVALPTLHERLTRSVEQPCSQRSLVREEEGVEDVWHGKHQVERRHRQPCRFPGLHPLALGKRLTLRAVAIATSILRIPLEPTRGTVFGVPTELRRPAGLAIVHHFLMRGRYGMGTAGGRPLEAEDIGDFPRGTAGLTHVGPTWAVGGMRRHGGTPAWRGVGPRKADGRTGGGSLPDAAG